MTTFGDDLLAANSEFTEQVQDMRRAVDSTVMNEWLGDSATAASARAWAETVSATQIDEAVTVVAGHHKAFGPQLTGIRTALLGIADSEVPAAGMQVADNGAVTPPRFSGAGPVLLRFVMQKQLNDQAAALESRITGLLGDFGNAESTATQAILRGANDLHALKQTPGSPTPHVAGTGPGEPGGPAYVLGPPTKPKIQWDETFKYDSRGATFADYKAAAKWKAMLAGGELARADLDDALAMYRHYWDNDGKTQEFDYREAYNEDPSIKTAVDAETSRAAAAADQLVRDGHTNFSITGDARAVGDPNHPENGPYPQTENWQKSIGAYQQWSHGNVHVEGNQVVMEVTVEAEDHYNFNKDQADIATGASDNDNGRFTEVGWAKPFDSHGSVTKTVTWPVGQPPDSATVVDNSEPQRNPGREDRIDNQQSSGPPLPADNNRNTGRATPR